MTVLVGKKVRILARRLVVARALEIRATMEWFEWCAANVFQSSSAVEGYTHQDRYLKFRRERERLQKRIFELVGFDYAQAVFGVAAVKAAQEGLGVWLTSE